MLRRCTLYDYQVLKYQFIEDRTDSKSFENGKCGGQEMWGSGLEISVFIIFFCLIVKSKFLSFI